MIRRRVMAPLVVGACTAALALTACDGPGLTGQTISEPHAPTLEHSETVPVRHVVDGDTIDVVMPDGSTASVRILGIDTPEVKKPHVAVQCWGPQASEFAHHAMDGQTVTLSTDPTQDDRDRYGRILRYVTLPDGSDYGLGAIAAGMAMEYIYDHHPVTKASAYRDAQNTARTQRLGLWGACPT